MEMLLTKKIDNIYQYMLIYYSYSLVGNILAGIRGYIFTTYIQILSTRIKENILSAFFKINLLSLCDKNASEIADILIKDSDEVSDLYCLNANILLRDLAQLSTITYILANISLELFAINIGLATLQLIIEHNYHKYIYERSVEKCTNILLKQNEIIHDYTHKTDTYKSLGMEDDIYLKWKDKENEYTKDKRLEATYYGIKVVVNQSINQLMILLLIGFGLWRNFSYENIIVFMAYNPIICGILTDTMMVRTSITKSRKSHSNIKEVFNESEKDTWTGSYMPYLEYPPKIELKEVSFAYNNDKTIFSNINLKFEPGKIVGIKGESGKGKSTLLKLVLGLYKPQKGNVIFDNVNIYDIDKDYFFSSIISFVGQEPVLFTGTTYDNIVSNLQDYDQHLYESFQDLIKDIPDNIKMSGGQRQRVAICRAFMRKPKILLLDEPTSALDELNEKKMLDMIKRIHAQNRLTIIIVSHKKSTLSICEKIIDL